jgi:hypothetical protein
MIDTVLNNSNKFDIDSKEEIIIMVTNNSMNLISFLKPSLEEDLVKM